MAERRGRVCASEEAKGALWLGREKTKRRGLRKFARVFAQPRQLSNPPRSRSEETGLLQLEPRPRHPAEERIVEREVNPGRG